ncbi:MAG TPA: bile acid:sodium symporter family protein [Candidatus Omnitrophota bacterium]|nr:bile acid:sodium symporter family protein [Candidatus Omnitrophota bacterium]
MPVINFLTNAFPFWVFIASLISLYHPPAFTWFSGPMIPAGLGIIMLGMGLTLSVEDFKGILKYPGWVITGILLQYTIMPFLGWSLSYAFNLPAPLAVGLILVSCCPSGTASNVVNYLARSNVALSVTMTAFGTFMAVALTPVLTAWLAGSRIHVDAWGLFLSTVQVVIVPIVLGVLMNRFFPKVTQKLTVISPLVAVIFITLIVASIVGAGQEYILKSGARLILAVFTLHSLGFLLGYLAGRIFLKNEIASRTISVEVGMQNSGLGVVLARQNFSSPLVAIPCAISSVFHSVLASLLASVWRLDANQYPRS